MNKRQRRSTSTIVDACGNPKTTNKKQVNKLRPNWIWSSATSSTLQPIPGVYAIYIGSQLIYIGTSRNLRKRLSCSHRQQLTYVFDPWVDRMIICFEFGDFATKEGRVTYKYRYERKLGEAAMAEIRLIHKLCPLGNTVGKKK